MKELYQPDVELPKMPEPEKGSRVFDSEKNEPRDEEAGPKEFINNQVEDPIEKELYNFLAREGVIMEKEGIIIVDTKKLKDESFKKRLWHSQFGEAGGKIVWGSRRIIEEKLGELKAVFLSDYLKMEQNGEKIEPYKVFEKQETVKEKLIDFLKQEKILENIDGYDVFDVKEFFSYGFIVKKLQHQHFGKVDGKKVQGSYKFIFEQLADMPIVSKEDFMAQKEKGERVKTKPLFNIPENIDEALDIKKVKQDNYYLNYWDLADPSRLRQINWQYKIKLKDGEEINAGELALFTKIFKDYEGKRGDDGILRVYDGLKHKYVQLSANWIRENIGGLGGANQDKTTIFEAPHNFLLNNCSNLLNKDLIKLADFKIKTNDKSGNLLRKEFLNLKKDSYAAINSIRYYIGRENFIFEGKSIPMENIKAAVLDDKTAGIIKSYKGRDSLLFTLKLLSEEEKEKKRQEIRDRKGGLSAEKVSAFAMVGGGEVKKRITAWRPTADNPKREDETPEEYAERIRYIGDYENLKQISDDFSRCGIGIHNLSWREQQWLCGAAYELGSENRARLLEFGKQYGLKGLKTFLSLEQGEEMGDKILNIGESFKKQPEAADLLFAEYARLVDKTEQAAEEMSRLYNEIFFEKQVDKNEVISAILKRASQLLVDAEKKSKDMPENDKETLIKELIEELIKEQMVQKRMLGEFKDMAVELNNQYKKIANMPLGLSPEEELELEKRQKEKRTEKTELPDWIANSFIDPMYEKFDTARIKDLISTYEGNYKPDDFQVGLHKYQGRMTDEEIKKLYEAEKSRYEPAVNKLKKLLDFQKAFEKKFEQIVKGEFHADTDSELMAKYREIEESVKNISEIIDESFKEAEVHIDPEKIKEMLLREAIDVVSTPTATKDDRETALKKLNGINANVLLTGKIISQLPPDEVAKLNLKKIPHIEKLEEVRGSELFNKPEILSQIKQAIKLQFPGGDDEIFEEECRNNPNLRLTITLANNKVISFFSKEKRSEKIDYIDWFIANPNAPIKGLGEATLKLGFNSEEENNKSYYAVAKPHAKSFQIFIENLGFAGFAGQTEKGEYKHYYSRLRRFPSDLKFKSKNLTNEKEESFFKTINYLCGEEGTVQDMIFDGRMMRVSKVKYSGQTAKDNISKADPEGLIMEEIDQQNKKGYVLTRFIPESPAKNNQVFYAVFEKDSAPEDLKEELAGVVSPDSSNLHSTSKKAFSN